MFTSIHGFCSFVDLVIKSIPEINKYRKPSQHECNILISKIRELANVTNTASPLYTARQMRLGSQAEATISKKLGELIRNLETGLDGKSGLSTITLECQAVIDAFNAYTEDGYSASDNVLTINIHQALLTFLMYPVMPGDEYALFVGGFKHFMYLIMDQISFINEHRRPSQVDKCALRDCIQFICSTDNPLSPYNIVKSYTSDEDDLLAVEQTLTKFSRYFINSIKTSEDNICDTQECDKLVSMIDNFTITGGGKYINPSKDCVLLYAIWPVIRLFLTEPYTGYAATEFPKAPYTNEELPSIFCPKIDTDENAKARTEYIKWLWRSRVNMHIPVSAANDVYTLNDFMQDEDTITAVKSIHQDYQWWFILNFTNGASSKEEVLSKLQIE